MTIFEREMKAAMERRAQEVREKFRLHCKCGAPTESTDKLCVPCRGKARVKVCSVCGKQFLAAKTGPDKVYCSSKCKYTRQEAPSEQQHVS